MPIQRTLLKDNFQELYSSLHTSSDRQLNLVANYSGTHIYNSTKGWGRFWRLFYRLTDLICHNNLRLNKLKEALIHTHDIFHKQLPILQIHLDNYLAYLKNASSGYLTNENQIHPDRNAIITWNSATSPSLKFFKKLQHKKIRGLIHACFGNKTSNPFTTPVTAQVKMCSRIISLEGISASSLPLEILKKVFKQKSTHALEIKGLKKWIHKLNKQASHLNTISKGLCSLTRFFNRHTDNQVKSHYAPETLFLFLKTHGCTVFGHNDQKQITWRTKMWKPGSILSQGQTVFKIGKPLCHTSLSTNNTLVFDLPDLPESIALIPPNRIFLTLARAEKETSSISSARIIEIMDGGRWALIERLWPIHSIPWKSTNIPLASDDLPKAHALVSLMKVCMETASTPRDLSPANIMFDAQGALKSLYPTPRYPFDFNALENFAYRSAAGNLAIFQYLMDNSGLANHAIAKYYMAIATSTLKKEAVHIANLGGVYRIGDSKVIDKAASFAKELSLLHSKITTTLQEKLPEYDPETLEKQVADTLLSHYRNNRTASFLWPTLAKSVIKTFLASRNYNDTCTHF